MNISLIPLFTAVLYAIAGIHAQVQVGSGGALKFSPETITASVGSMVNFTIVGQIHTVTESTSKLNGPCTTGAGGFDSGPTHDGQIYSVAVSDQNSIYVHCTPHCALGMVMIINPGPNDNIETFRAAAMGHPSKSSASSAISPSSTSPSASSTSTPTSTAAATKPSGAADRLEWSISSSLLLSVLGGVFLF